jgi:tripartite-type tricarboxylate transporter receptor subunit TctC
MRTLALTLTLLTLLAAVPVPAPAQESFPTRPITIVNPYPPGGQADLAGRPFVAALEKVVKQPVVITNKAGAAGAVGMQSVAVAKPDGYTVLITVPSLHTLPEVDKLFARTPTFTRDQFVPIARLNADPLVVAVNAERPWKTMKELLDDAKKRPGEITFSSAGIYGATHVPMEMILQAGGGLKMRHLPTAGGGPALTAVLGGHADLWSSTIGPATPHIKSGKIRPLAVTSAKRHDFFPDVPTLKELGYDVEYYLWIGLFVPKATPPAVVKTLREATKQAAEDPAFKSALEKISSHVAYQDADEFKTFLDADATKLAEVIRKIGKVEVK